MQSIREAYNKWTESETQELIVKPAAEECAPAMILTLLKASQSKEIDSSLVSFFLITGSVCALINIIYQLSLKHLQPRK